MINFTPDSLDWSAIGDRLKSYRLVKGLTGEQLSTKCGLPLCWIDKVEKGGRSKSLEELWAFVKSEGVSVNWLFNGIGDFLSDDPPEILPPTILRFRSAGVRRSKERINAEEGYISGDPLDFLLAVDAYKKLNNKNFPTLTEVFEIMLSLGYRKVAPATINPRQEIK